MPNFEELNKDPRYQQAYVDLDAAIVAWKNSVNTVVNDLQAQQGEEGDPPLAVVGWIVGVAVTGYRDDGKQVNDLYFERTNDLNNYMAHGMALALCDEMDPAGWSDKEDD